MDHDGKMFRSLELLFLCIKKVSLEDPSIYLGCLLTHPGISHWEETLRQTQNSLEDLKIHFDLNMPWDPPAGAEEYETGNGADDLLVQPPGGSWSSWLHVTFQLKVI
ncbi:hypothetical protein ILYODFUR_007560 [Ilyodon furcidens]|uniref:Uncharacterized protein n=1 Tax=Ilyodon furcidens TaxID=33524 RepID=A0ABV0VDE5_9TELE